MLYGRLVSPPSLSLPGEARSIGIPMYPSTVFTAGFTVKMFIVFTAGFTVGLL